MKKFLISAVFLLSIFLFGCTSINMNRFVEIDYQDKIEKGKMIDTISYVLLSNGFEIADINETYGLVTTSWKDLQTQGKNIGLTLLTASRYSSTLYSDAVKLTFRITDSGYAVYPKQARISSTSNALVQSSSTNEMTPSENSVAGKLAVKVINEINDMLKQSTEIVWREELAE